jgi:hypothetical protein
MALLTKLGLVSYPEMAALTDSQQSMLLDELKLNMLQLVLTDKDTQDALKQRMAPAVQALKGK